MRLKILILDIVLTCVYLIVRIFSINKNQIVFVSLSSKTLNGDMKMIYDRIKDDYNIKTVMMKYKKKSIISNFLYLINTIKQCFVINRSSLVIIDNNNYVATKFKRKEVRVLQIWHATGAIKQFGNCVNRKFEIKNYDYIIANSDYWKEPYAKAFGVQTHQIVTLGMPRLDSLLNKSNHILASEKFFSQYPYLKDKTIILYAPTFRGNIHKHIYNLHINMQKVVDELPLDFVILLKFHPLTKNNVRTNDRIIDFSKYNLYDLFTVSDILISDYSSIIFDYSLLNKPMVFYSPDRNEYENDIGFFVNYDNMPGEICENEIQLSKALINATNTHIESFSNTYLEYKDTNNTERVVNFIKDIMLDF